MSVYCALRMYRIWNFSLSLKGYWILDISVLCCSIKYPYPSHGKFLGLDHPSWPQPATQTPPPPPLPPPTNFHGHQFGFIHVHVHSFINFGCWDWFHPPWNFQYPSMEEVWIFSGTMHFLNAVTVIQSIGWYEKASAICPSEREAYILCNIFCLFRPHSLWPLPPCFQVLQSIAQCCVDIQCVICNKLNFDQTSHVSATTCLLSILHVHGTLCLFLH